MSRNTGPRGISRGAEKPDASDRGPRTLHSHYLWQCRCWGRAEKGPRAGGEAAWPETPLSRRLTASSSWPSAESHLYFRGRESDLCLPIARLSQRVIKMMSVNTPQTGLPPTSVERASGVSQNAPAVRRRGKKGGKRSPLEGSGRSKGAPHEQRGGPKPERGQVSYVHV